MIRILYFARLREALGTEAESLEWTIPVSIAELKRQLAGRGDVWQEQFAANTSLRAALNQTLVPETAMIQHGDEVAFFPPVTGG